VITRPFSTFAIARETDLPERRSINDTARSGLDTLNDGDGDDTLDGGPDQDVITAGVATM